ncbi:MAG TPA: TonB family protein [Usitatibacter sp.]|nr:TonB family protein [Usitatibacter sp.]
MTVGSIGTHNPPSSPASRFTLLFLIAGAHVLALVAVASLGGVAAAVEKARPLLLQILPEPPRATPVVPAKTVPLPQLRKPEVVIPEPPRFEIIQAVQVVEKPAPPPPPPPKAVPAPVPEPAPPPQAAPVLEPPRFNLAYLNNPAPAYPIFAKRAREQGTVMLRVQVDAAGKVESIEVHRSSGSDRLDDAALAAVRRWRFVPARQGSRAVAGVALVPIHFELES